MICIKEGSGPAKLSANTSECSLTGEAAVSASSERLNDTDLAFFSFSCETYSGSIVSSALGRTKDTDLAFHFFGHKPDFG